MINSCRTREQGNYLCLPMIKRALQYLCSMEIEKLLYMVGIRRVLWGTMGAGALLRAFQYLTNRSLWFDEAMLALNIINRSWLDLFRPLEYDQAAPFGFLILQKVVVEVIGKSEFTLRLVPFLCGMVAILLFYKVAKYFLEIRSLLIAVILFSFSYRLIYYSSEVKPYIVDVFVVLLIFLLALEFQSKHNRKSFLILSCVGAASVWVSYPSIFVLAGVCSCLLADSLNKKEWLKVKWIFYIIPLWVTSFALLYTLSSKGATNQYLLDYWSHTFMPFPPRSIEDIKWFDNSVIKLFQNPLGLFPSSLAALLFLSGCISMGTKNPGHVIMLLSPAIFALLASGLGRYPFSGRLLIFVIPSILILVAAGGIGLNNIKEQRVPRINKVIILLLLIPTILYSVSIVAKPLGDEDIKSLMTYIKKNWQKGDIVYVHFQSVPAFEYYKNKYGFDRDHYYAGRLICNVEPQACLDELDELADHKRLWLLFSHIRRGNKVEEDIHMTTYLRSKCACAESLRAGGAFLYLCSQQ